MPERNLVTVVCSQWIERLPFAILALSFCLPAGCSQLKPRGLRDVMAQQPTPSDWRRESTSELERSYLDDPTTFEKVSAKSAVSTQGGGGKSATQGIQDSISDQSTHNHAPGEVCDHPGCGSKRVAPKLAHVEPFEFPGSGPEISPVVESKSPPSITHPLSPLLFDRETRAVRSQKPSDLRYEGDWNTEKSANVKSKSNTTSAAKTLVEVPVGTNPIRLRSASNPAAEQSSARLETTSNRLANPLSAPIQLTSGETKSETVSPETATTAKTAIANLPAPEKTERKKIAEPTVETQPAVAKKSVTAKPELTTTKVVTSQTNSPNRAKEPTPELQASSATTKPMTAQLAGIKVDKNQFELPPSKPVQPAVGIKPATAKTTIATPVNSKIEKDDSESFAPIKVTAVQPIAIPTAQPKLVTKPVASTNLPNRKIEDLTDTEFTNMFGLPPASALPAVCKSCGTASCRGNCQTQFSPPTVNLTNPIVPDSSAKSSDFPIGVRKPPVAVPDAARKTVTIPTDFQPVQPTESIATVGHFEQPKPNRQSEKRIEPKSDPASKPIEKVSKELAPEPQAKPSPAPKLESKKLEETKPTPVLKLTNAEFCTEIKGFGQITPFASTRFGANQRTLVYCEVEDYHSLRQQTPAGSKFVTRLRGRYSIVDQQGTVVQSGDFPDVEDITVRQRRDFYLYFPVTLKNLDRGDYQLKLTIEDLSSQQLTVANSQMRFSVN